MRAWPCCVPQQRLQSAVVCMRDAQARAPAAAANLGEKVFERTEGTFSSIAPELLCVYVCVYSVLLVYPCCARIYAAHAPSRTAVADATQPIRNVRNFAGGINCDNVFLITPPSPPFLKSTGSDFDDGVGFYGTGLCTHPLCWPQNLGLPRVWLRLHARIEWTRVHWHKRSGCGFYRSLNADTSGCL